MSHENSIQIDQQELPSEYGRYVETKSKNGIMSFFVKALVIPVFALLIILTGASFAVANFSPAMYTQAKDILFEKVDFEQLTGQPNSINKEYLDSWLILNSEKLQGEEKALQNTVQEEQIERQLN